MDRFDHEVTFFLQDEDATARFGGWLAGQLQGGDCVLLSGPIGAGKSHLARAFIRQRLGRMEDVPSPTFTLVQIYDADVEIWHADLYRLSHPDEVAELGLQDAFSHAICLVEWPDRLGNLAPEHAIRIELCTLETGRKVSIKFDGRANLLASIRRDWIGND